MPRRKNTISGNVAFITGAAQGVGFATARALAANGAKVVLADIDSDAVTAAAERIGGNAVGVTLDVTDHLAYAAALDTAEAHLGPVTILINNAGIMPVGPFELETDETAQRVIDINFTAMLFASKQAVRRFKDQGAQGHIVNVASGAGWIPGGGAVSYAGSKFAVVGFSQALSWELRGTGIDVSVVAPAIINTRLGAGLADVPGLRKIDAEDVAEAIVRGLERPRFVIWVPATMGLFALAFSALPYRARAWLARTTGADKLLLRANTQERADYEASITPSNTTMMSAKPALAQRAVLSTAKDEQ